MKNLIGMKLNDVVEQHEFWCIDEDIDFEGTSIWGGWVGQSPRVEFTVSADGTILEIE